MSMIAVIFVLSGMIAMTGCQTDTHDIPIPSETVPGSISSALPDASGEGIATPDRINPLATRSPERVPPTEATTPVTGETPPELLDLIKQDLAARTGAALENVVVFQDQEIVWNDGSLGCPKPGEFYTQALVNGYWVILEVDGVKYDYRLAASGYFILCEGGLPPVSPPASPNS